MEVGTFRGGNNNMNQNFVFKQELGRLCPPLKKKKLFFFGVGQKSNFRVIISLFFFMEKDASILK